MSTNHSSAIRRMVDHHGGVTEFAKLLGSDYDYQQIQQWLERDWASPLHFMSLQPLLLDGMTLLDLFADIENFKKPRKAKPAQVAA